MITAGLEWFQKQPASPKAIADLRAELSVDLPQEYFDLLAFSNGGEGPLSVSPYTFCLDSAEEALDYNKTNSLHDHFPGLFIFGGNGAGELIAFDIRALKPWPIVAFDSANTDLTESVVPIAKDFAGFLSLAGLWCENA